jgi:hypothetical protein
MHRILEIDFDIRTNYISGLKILEDLLNNGYIIINATPVPASLNQHYNASFMYGKIIYILKENNEKTSSPTVIG